MVTKSVSNIIIEPPSELTIKTVGELYAQTKEQMDEYEIVFVNLVAVSEIDTAGIQLLISLKKEVDAKGKIFDVVGLSAEVDEIFSLYGVGPYFGK
jgi:ABC-type transporter Mla MlaB component